MVHYGMTGSGWTLVTDNYYATIASTKNIAIHNIKYISTARESRCQLDKPIKPKKTPKKVKECKKAKTKLIPLPAPTQIRQQIKGTKGYPCGGSVKKQKEVGDVRAEQVD